MSNHPRRRLALVHDHAIVVDVNEDVCLSGVHHVEQGARFYVLPCPTKRPNRAQPHYEDFALVATTKDFG